MISTTEFNKKYNLESFNKKWFTQISKEEYESKSAKNTISGKTSKVWIDITKRFFKNKWNIIFLSIAILVFFFMIFGPLFSNFSATSPISKAANIDNMLPGFAEQPHSQTGTISELQTSIDGTMHYDPVLNTLVTDTKDVIVSAKFDPTHGVWSVVYHNPHYVSTVLGTDGSGIPVYNRLISSMRFSISLALLATIVESLVGVVVGMYLGFNAGKAIDTYFMRVIEIFRSIPALLLITIFVLILGKGFGGMFFALVLIGWVTPVYITRMFTIKVKDAEFIKASQSIGASQNRIIFKHVLPNVVGRVLVSFVQRIPLVIFIEATLVFLGIEVGGGTRNTLGNMLSEARNVQSISENPYFLISAATVVLLFTLSLQIMANGLRDAFDAKVSG